MSYEPNRHLKSEFMSAWNSSSQTVPRYDYEVDANNTFELNLVGVESDGHTIVSNALTPADSLYGYFTGDIRVNTYNASGSEIYGDQFSIRFELNDGDTSGGYQAQRYHRADDQCYSIASSAKLQQRETFRSDGNTIAPYVRVLGVLIEEQ